MAGDNGGVVDLTEDEEFHRKKIMAFATRVNNENLVQRDPQVPGGGTSKALQPALPLGAQPQGKRQRVTVEDEPESHESQPQSNTTSGPVLPSEDNLRLGALVREAHARRQLAQAASAHGAQQQASASASVSHHQEPGSHAQEPVRLTVLSYNVWFEHSVAVHDRMKGLAAIIESTTPDILLFQEVTHAIFSIWSGQSWFQQYHHSPVSYDMPYFTMLFTKTATVQSARSFNIHHFSNSVMGRGVLYTSVTVCGLPLMLATSHLESPVSGNMYSSSRVAQLREASQLLSSQNQGDIVYAGDMNWQDDGDGPAVGQLQEGWVDAWNSLHPGHPGHTYDPRGNPMLTGNWRGRRLDRAFCKLSQWQLESMEVVGKDPLPGVKYKKNGKELPVLPSDHYGLLLTLKASAPAPQAKRPGHVLGSAPVQHPGQQQQQVPQQQQSKKRQQPQCDVIEID